MARGASDRRSSEGTSPHSHTCNRRVLHSTAPWLGAENGRRSHPWLGGRDDCRKAKHAHEWGAFGG